MSLEKSSKILGKDHYRLLYQAELEKEAEWLRRGAVEKVNSIETLLERNNIKPKSFLELGCGVGSVITECKRRSLASRYIGVDYSKEAIDYLRSHSEGIESIQADISDPDFNVIETPDVVILSHVLEHLENPADFLAAMKRRLRFSYAVIEVPLEDLIASRLKSLLKDRATNNAGHVQFFTTHTFKHLLNSSGFKIVDSRTYVPILDLETIRFVSDKDGLSNRQYIFKVLTAHYLPRALKPLWKKLYYAHYTVLCVAVR